MICNSIDKGAWMAR